MPRTNRPPSYRLHKARKCAVVTINGENRYLGPYGSPESHEKYARLIAEWQANGKSLAVVTTPSKNRELSVNDLILWYLNFSTSYYVKHGKPTGEVNNIRHAVAKLKELYGHTKAKEFSPAALEM
jgi:hypothetical protein